MVKTCWRKLSCLLLVLAQKSSRWKLLKVKTNRFGSGRAPSTYTLLSCCKKSDAPTSTIDQPTSTSDQGVSQPVTIKEKKQRKIKKEARLSSSGSFEAPTPSRHLAPSPPPISEEQRAANRAKFHDLVASTGLARNTSRPLTAHERRRYNSHPVRLTNKFSVQHDHDGGSREDSCNNAA